MKTAVYKSYVTIVPKNGFKNVKVYNKAKDERHRNLKPIICYSWNIWMKDIIRY